MDPMYDLHYWGKQRRQEALRERRGAQWRVREKEIAGRHSNWLESAPP